MNCMLPEKNSLLGPPSSMAGSPINTTLTNFSGFTRRFLSLIKSSHSVFLLIFIRTGWSFSIFFWTILISVEWVRSSLTSIHISDALSNRHSSLVVASPGPVSSPNSIMWDAHTSACSSICSIGNLLKHVGHSIPRTKKKKTQLQ